MGPARPQNLPRRAMVWFMVNSSKAGPSRAWYILPGVLLFAAALLAGLGISSFVNFVASDFRAVQPGSPISATKDGFTLYTDTQTAVSRPADLRCTAIGQNRAVQLQDITGRTTLGNGQTTFVALASTPSDLPAGRYVVSCTSVSSNTEMPLYLGPRFDVAAVGRLVAFNVITPLLLGFSALVIFTIVAVRRYRANRNPSATTQDA